MNCMTVTLVCEGRHGETVAVIYIMTLHTRQRQNSHDTLGLWGESTVNLTVVSLTLLHGLVDKMYKNTDMCLLKRPNSRTQQLHMSHFVKIFIKRLKVRKLKMCVSDERVNMEDTQRWQNLTTWTRKHSTWDEIWNRNTRSFRETGSVCCWCLIHPC